MEKGQYRGYFHIGPIGIKFAKFKWSYTNTIATFFAGIIMNLLERKRYKYYVLRKPMWQWNRKWYYLDEELALCPVYFSCGLFNIVKHLPGEVTYEDLKTKNVISDIDERYWDERTGYLLDEIVPKHFRKDEKGNILAIDYGYFQVTGYRNVNVSLIDYK